MSEAIQNQDAERAVLGSLLVHSPAIKPVLLEARLRPDHFYREQHRMIFQAILDVHEAGALTDPIAVGDALTKRSQLDSIGGLVYLHELAATTTAPATAGHNAKIVVEGARWRQYDGSAKLILEAVEQRDTAKLGDARASLDQAVTTAGRDLDPEALADLAFEIMDGGGKEAFPWPFRQLNNLGAGGMRRGQFVVISGHTHFGKSVFCDQVLQTVAETGAKTWLYMNEMDPEERIGGLMQRLGGVPFADFIQGKVREEHRRKALDVLNRGFPFGITPIAGWNAHEVCSHIRMHRPDVCAVDILHRFPHREERDLAEIVELFAETAKLADCVVILVAHVNRNRIFNGVRPQPTRGDLRGSGSIENDADVVCFVHREQDDETFEPLPAARIYFDKYRGGSLGGIDCEFNAERIRFESGARRLAAVS